VALTSGRSERSQAEIAGQGITPWPAISAWLLALVSLVAFVIASGVWVVRAHAETATAAGASGTTLILVEHAALVTEIDLGEPGPSIGDMLVWGPYALYDEAEVFPRPVFLKRSNLRSKIAGSEARRPALRFRHFTPPLTDPVARNSALVAVNRYYASSETPRRMKSFRT
jgi:hypothetical protein